MTATCLISLVGEQPVPNLLPVRFLKPDRVLLLYTDRTRRVAEHLKGQIDVRVSMVSISDPGRLDRLAETFRALPLEGFWPVWNLTGGTKPMAMAALMVAASQRADVLYLEPHPRSGLLHRYGFDPGAALPVHRESTPLPADLIDLSAYLRVHCGDYRTQGFSQEKDGSLNNGGRFEKVVCETLRSAGFEVLAGVVPAGMGNQMEIDLLVRSGNEVAVLELKVGQEHIKKGLDQLKAATTPLGTYTRAILVIAGQLNQGLRMLAKKQRIEVIELPGYDGRRHLLSDADADHLIDQVQQLLGPPGVS